MEYYFSFDRLVLNRTTSYHIDDTDTVRHRTRQYIAKQYSTVQCTTYKDSTMQDNTTQFFTTVNKNIRAQPSPVQKVSIPQQYLFSTV